MMGSHLCSRRTRVLLLLSLGAGMASAQINDTGQDTCYDGSTLAPCADANTGNAATYPRQDGRIGRDAAAAGELLKTGGGAAGFDFTPLDASGNPIPLTDTPPLPSVTPVCIRDNHTNLIWEVKTSDGGLSDNNWTYTWYDGNHGFAGDLATCNDTLSGASCNTQAYASAANTAGLCGYHTGWRLPTRRELNSLVHNGAHGPAIDTSYFPNTVKGWYWSADLFAPNPAIVWNIDFDNGDTNADYMSAVNYVRLVRSGH